ncbi:hypothetical protein [Streptomyces sp. CO7]
MATPSPDPEYAITTMYSVPDDAWYLELDLVGTQRAVVTAIVPDEDPAREPTVCFGARAPEEHLDVPYAVMAWFLSVVEEEIHRSRAWMRLRPDLVEVVHDLRQEHLGMVSDDDFDGVLADLRDTVADSDLPAVLAAAFGRKPDGSFVSDDLTAP